MPSFFLKDTAPTKIYTFPCTTPFRSIRAALALISCSIAAAAAVHPVLGGRGGGGRKNTPLNSSHPYLSYAVFFFKGYGAHQDLHFSLHDALPIYPSGVSADQLFDRRRRRRPPGVRRRRRRRSEEHTSELQSPIPLICRLFF